MADAFDIAAIPNTMMKMLITVANRGPEAAEIVLARATLIELQRSRIHRGGR